MTSPSILIIDDDPDFADLLKSIIKTRSYQVDVAYQVEDALSILQQKTPDLIILDIMLGWGAEGLVFARKIKKDPRLADIPILVLTSMQAQTGFDFPGAPIHPQFFPVNECLRKPAEIRVIFEKIEQYLAPQRVG